MRLKINNNHSAKYIKPTAEMSTYFQKENIISRKYLIRCYKLLFNCDCQINSDIISQVHKLCLQYKQCHAVKIMAHVTATLIVPCSHKYTNSACCISSAIQSQVCQL